MGQLHFDDVPVDGDDADVERGLGAAPLEEAGRLAQYQADGRDQGEEVTTKSGEEVERKQYYLKRSQRYFSFQNRPE